MIEQIISRRLQIPLHQVQGTVCLLREGATIPFISRYRKEATGSLNDEVLRQLDERLRYLRNLEDKKEQQRIPISRLPIWLFPIIMI